MVFGNTHAPCLQLRVLGSLHFLRPTARRFYWYHDAHSRSGTMAVFKGASAGAASNKRLKLRGPILGGIALSAKELCSSLNYRGACQVRRRSLRAIR